MTIGKCNYCKKNIDIKTYSNDKGEYYCSVICFEKYLKEKARRKKYIIGYTVGAVIIVCFSLIFISFSNSLNKQQVSENLQPTVQNISNLANNKSKDVITVSGNEQFTATINKALDLLKKYNYPQYNLLVQLNCSIQLSQEVKGKLAATADKNKIIIFNTLTEDTARFIPEQLAGIIVHQAAHVIGLTQRDPSLKPEDYEKMALENEISTYKLVGAPQWILEEALGRKNTPAVYTIVDGDNPWLIAQKIYGDGNKAQLILDANKDILDNGSLTIGQQLAIPRGIEQN